MKDCPPPPRLAACLVRRMFPDRGGSSVLGDMTETYRVIAADKGVLAAIQMRREHASAAAFPPALQFERFSRLNRILHVLMIVSFMSLALTGMTLKFSYTGWASWLSRMLGGYETAGYIHRLAALVMIGIFVTHIYDLVRRKRVSGRTWKAMLLGPDTMLPTRKDLSDVAGSVKWFLGLGPRPQYGRWTYWEKFDYFAVFWGSSSSGQPGWRCGSQSNLPAFYPAGR